MASTVRAAVSLAAALFRLPTDAVVFETLSGAVDLSTTAGRFTRPFVWAPDPGGAHRDVTLEPEADAAGIVRLIMNSADAAENLVIKDDGGNTIVTLAQNDAAILWCDGSTWADLPARFTTALS
jgi:hypothetical protein